MNAKNGDVGAGASGGDSEQVKEHLRQARDAAANAARARAQQAQDWARSQLSDIQARVQAEPYKATAWALGAGFLAGILLMSLLRTGRR